MINHPSLRADRLAASDLIQNQDFGRRKIQEFRFWPNRGRWIRILMSRNEIREEYEERIFEVRFWNLELDPRLKNWIYDVHNWYPILDFDFETEILNLARVLFCILTSFSLEIRPKSSRIAWFFLASRRSHENFVEFFFNHLVSWWLLWTFHWVARPI